MVVFYVSSLMIPPKFGPVSLKIFPCVSVEGHGTKFVFGVVEGVPCVCMTGRIHFYEGHPMWKVEVINESFN